MRMWTKILILLLLPLSVCAENDFTADSNCVALYRHESGAMATDSIGTNNLDTNGSIAAQTGDYQEGAACGDYESGDSDYMYLADGSLSSDFPGKSLSSNINLSVTAWVKIESLSEGKTICCKWITAAGAARNSYRCGVLNNSGNYQQYIAIGYTNTASNSAFNTQINCVIATWYHLAWTWEDSTKTYKMRVTEPNDTTHDVTNTFANAINIDEGDFEVGILAHGNGDYTMMDGFMDELVIFNDILTNDEIQMIYEGTYPSGSSAKVLPTIMVNSEWENNRWQRLWR